MRLAGENVERFCRNFAYGVCIQIQMRRDHLGRQAPYPVIQGKVHIQVGFQHFEKHQIRIAGVLDVVTRCDGYDANVIGVEVHRARSFAGKDCHAPLTAKVVLPFRSVWMPMQFAQTTRLNGDQGCSDIFRHWEVMRVNHANGTAPRLLRGGHSLHSERVLVGGFDATAANSGLVLCQRCGQVRGKDVKAPVR